MKKIKNFQPIINPVLTKLLNELVDEYNLLLIFKVF